MALFDSTIHLEQTHFNEGYDEGYKDGQIAAKEEGRLLGLKTGFEVGEEFGFYRGCVDIWNSAIRVDPNCYSSRIKLGIEQMEELLEKYPIRDPENLQDIMDSLRLKFKMVSSSLHVKLEYDGYPKSSTAIHDIEILCFKP